MSATKIVFLPVHGGPEGRAYVQMQQSVRRSPAKFRSHHLVLAYAAGFLSAVGVMVAAIVN